MKRQRNTGCAFTGLVGAKMRVLVRRVSKRLTRKAVKCMHGPLSNCTLRLDVNGGYHTLPFTLNGESGRYVNGIWEPTP